MNEQALCVYKAIPNVLYYSPAFPYILRVYLFLYICCYAVPALISSYADPRAAR